MERKGKGKVEGREQKWVINGGGKKMGEMNCIFCC